MSRLQSLRSALIPATLALACLLGGHADPARADDHGWDRGPPRYWHHDRDWRRGRYPGYYVAPQPIYAPPPVVYAPPPPPLALNLVIPFNFR